MLPVNATANVFVDAFVVSGKSDVNRALGGSLIVGGGGGLGFSDLFAWRSRVSSAIEGGRLRDRYHALEQAAALAGPNSGPSAACSGATWTAPMTP